MVICYSKEEEIHKGPSSLDFAALGADLRQDSAHVGDVCVLSGLPLARLLLLAWYPVQSQPRYPNKADDW